MTVRAILDAKGRQVVSIGADAKLSSAVKILSEALDLLRSRRKSGEVIF